MNSSRKLALFEEKILPHLNSAYNLARWLTRDAHDAEDIVQEAYLRAFRFFDSFQGGDGKAWLLAVVRNTSLTWRRREKRITKVAFDEKLHSSGEQSTAAETGSIQNENLARVRNCLDGLAPEFREVLVMRELDELAYRDIAQVTGLPIGTVMSRLSRARKRLQDCMGTRMKGAAQ